MQRNKVITCAVLVLASLSMNASKQCPLRKGAHEVKRNVNCVVDKGVCVLDNQNVNRVANLAVLASLGYAAYQYGPSLARQGYQLAHDRLSAEGKAKRAAAQAASHVEQAAQQVRTAAASAASSASSAQEHKDNNL